MSKKEEEVLTSDEYTYKKSHGCLKSIIVCLVLLVVFVATIFGGVYFAWGKFVEPKTDLTFGDGMGIITSLYGADEKKIITKPYDYEKEKAAFYTDFKSKLYLDEKVDLAIKDIMDIATNGKGGGPNPNDPIPESGTMDENGNVVQTDYQVVPTSTGNESLDTLLDKIHFNFESLREYTGFGDIPKQVLHIKDSQFAAVINEAFEYFSTEEAAQKIPSIAQYQKYFKHIHMGQVAIDSTIQGDAASTKLQLLLKIDTRDLVGDILPESIPAFLRKMIGGMLPKKIFVGLNVFPPKVNEDGSVVNPKDAEAIVVINSLKEELAIKLMNAVGKLTGKTGEQSIMGVINDKVCDVIAKVNTKVPLYFDESNCDIEPIAGLMNMLKVKITEGQFLGMIRNIKLPKPAEIKVSDIEGDNRTMATILPDEERNTAVEGFITSFTDKIKFDNVDKTNPAAPVPVITPENVFSKISTLTKDEEMLKRIDFSKLEYLAPGEYNKIDPKTNEPNKNKFKIDADYMAVAGLINSSLNKSKDGPVVDGGETAPEATQTDEAIEPAPEKKHLPIKILTFNYDDNKDIIKVVAALDVYKLVGDSLAGKNNSEVLTKFAQELLPEYIFFKMGIFEDESLGKDPIIQLNHLNEEQTATIIEVVGELARALHLGGDDFDMTKLSKEMETAVRANLKKVNATLGSDIVFKANGASIPSIFEIVANLNMFKDVQEDGSSVAVATDEEIHDIFRDTYKYEKDVLPSKFTKDYNDVYNVKNVVKTELEIESKYFMTNKDAEGNVIPLFDNKTPIFEQIAAFKDNYASKIDVERMLKTNYNAENPKLSGGVDATIDKLLPAIPQNELGYLINDTKKLEGIVASLKDVKVIRTEIKDGHLDLEITGTLNLEGDNAKYANILPKQIYVSVSTNLVNLLENSSKAPLPAETPLTEIVSYTTFQITNMDKATMDAFVKIMEKVSKKPFKIDEMEKKAQLKLEDTLRTLKFGKNPKNYDRAKIDISYTNEVLDIKENITDMGYLNINTSIYELAVNNIFKNAEEKDKLYYDENKTPEANAEAIAKDPLLNAKIFKAEMEALHRDLETITKNSDTDAHSDESRLIKTELPSKYFVDLKSNNPNDNTSVITKIGWLKSEYFERVNGQNMADNPFEAKDASTLVDSSKLVITAGELANILEGNEKVEGKLKLKLKAMKNEKLSLIRMEILDKDPTGTQGYMKLIFEGEIDKDNIKDKTPAPVAPDPVVEGEVVDPKPAGPSQKDITIEKFLPKAIRIEVKINKALLDSIPNKNPELTPEVAEQAQKDAVIASGNVNDMVGTIINYNTDKNESVDFVVFNKIYKAVANKGPEDKGIDVDTMKVDAAVKAHNAMGDLSNGVGMELCKADESDTNLVDGFIRIDNIYKLALSKIYKDKEIPAYATEVNLQNTIKNLFNGRVGNVGAQKGEEVDIAKETTKVTKSDKAPTITEQDVNNWAITAYANVSTSIVDKNILFKANQKVSEETLKTKFNGATATYKQVALIKQGDKADASKAYGLANVASNLLALTINVNLKEMMKKADATMIPEWVDASILLNLADTSNIEIKINTLTNDEYSLISDILNKDGKANSISADKMQEIIKEVLAIEIVKPHTIDYNVKVPVVGDQTVSIGVPSKTFKDILGYLGNNTCVYTSSTNINVDGPEGTQQPNENHFGSIVITNQEIELQGTLAK